MCKDLGLPLEGTGHRCLQTRKEKGITIIVLKPRQMCYTSRNSVREEIQKEISSSLAESVKVRRNVSAEMKMRHFLQGF